MMICPVCKSALRPFAHGGQTIDVCPECAGIWFDADEIGPVVGELVSQGVVPDQPARDAFNVHPKARRDDEPNRLCPRCGVLTQTLNYAYDSNVILNKCPSCRGLWADKGEVQRIAQYLKGNPAVNRYAQSLAEAVVKERAPTWLSRLLRSRLLSGAVALLYLIVAGANGDVASFARVAMWLVLPVACIWYADAMGGYTGLVSLARPAISRPAPGFAIALAGWILLLAPIVACVFAALTS
jgi:Zn-finger nucleic acid-binding protein